MNPGRLLADCQNLKAGGTYTIREASEKKEVSFFLDRDGSGHSIRRLQEVLASGQFVLGHKEPHAARIPADGADSLWLDIAHADGTSDSLRVFNGTSLVASDGVTDWHWTNENAELYLKIVNALAPNAEEQHVDRVKSASAAEEGDAR